MITQVCGPQFIMSDATRRVLHEVLESIDHVHQEKDRRLQDNRRKLAEFVASLPRFAEEFTRSMGRSEFRLATAPEPQYPDRYKLAIFRNDAPFATVVISGTASSNGVHISEVEFAKLNPIQPFAEVHERLSELLIRRIEAAGKDFNKF